MPNLRQIISFKKQYSELTESELELERYLSDDGLLKKAFNSTSLFEHFEGILKPEIIEYFDNNEKENVVLLFIDIDNFSTIIENKSPESVKVYLDNYYSRAFPIIYQYGGQIEKLMGDGIICVFGKPFLEGTRREFIYLAHRCAKNLIKEFYATNKAVKIAFHSGEVMYYKPPTDTYDEFTMIGKPITELYRLESVSRVNAINYFKDSTYDNYISNLRLFHSSYVYRNQIQFYGFDVDLRGINYNRVKYMRFNNL